MYTPNQPTDRPTDQPTNLTAHDPFPFEKNEKRKKKKKRRKRQDNDARQTPDASDPPSLFSLPPFPLGICPRVVEVS